MTWREVPLLKHAVSRSAPGAGGTRVVIPSGDDMAMLQLPGRELLAAVDQTIDGRHVMVSSTSLELIARKAINRCVSDVAAMAAQPCASLVAGVLPPDFGEERARALIDALHDAARHAEAPIIGGDLAMHAEQSFPLTLSVTVLAVPGPHPPVRRSGAREGDVIAVTGALGGSLEANGQGRHLTFTPRVAEALELSALIGDRLHAMIDISDGLGGDLAHLLFPLDEAQEDARSLRIVIDEEAIPCSPGATIETALGDGEDYELLLAAEGPLPSALCGGTPLSIIGRVERGTPGVFLRSRGGMLTDVRSKGWQHGS